VILRGLFALILCIALCGGFVAEVFDDLVRWTRKVAGYLWAILSAVALGLLLVKYKSQKRRAGAAADRLQIDAEDFAAHQWADIDAGVARSQDAQRKAEAARAAAERRIDDIAKADDDLADLIHRWNRDRVQ